MDGWTAIRYGQMESEAVWKTEFLFNCDMLEFVSIQKGGKMSMLAFLTKWKCYPHNCFRNKGMT